MVLADHVVIEDLADLLGRRNAVARLHQRGLVLLADDVHAQLDALVADEDGRSSNKLAHLMLALAAERAVERVLCIAAADFTHPSLRSAPPRLPSPASGGRWERACYQTPPWLFTGFAVAPKTKHAPGSTNEHANGNISKIPLTKNSRCHHARRAHLL